MRHILFAGATMAAVMLVPLAAWAAESSADAAVQDGQNTASVNEIVVTGERARTELKGDVPLLETPQNIQVLSSALLVDQGANLLENALQNVAGVMTGGSARSFDYFRIRGFDASGYTYVDGLPRIVTINVELAGADSIEVVKGPSSVLFGAGSPGGLVNIISKRPTKDAFLDIEGSYGSFDSYEGLVDVGGPLNSQGNVYARLVTHYRDDKSYIDFHPDTKRLYVAPSLTWEVDQKTKITFLASRSQDWSDLIPDQPAAGLVYAGPLGYYNRSVYIGDPSHKGLIDETLSAVGYELKHEFNDSVSLYQNLRYSHLNLGWTRLYQPLSYDPTTGIQSEFGEDYYENEDVYSVDTGLNSRFSTGPISHQLTIGTEYEGLRDQSLVGLGFSPAILFNIYSPNYSVFTPQPRTFYNAATRSDAYGFYIQDTAKLWGPFGLTLGGRYDSVKIDSGAAAKYTKFTPRAGLTYDFAPGLVGYLSYSRSFLPQPGDYDLSGNPVPPETGEAYEAGLKLALMDGRINSTLSVFQITRANVATAVPSSPSIYAVTGQQRSRGFEFDGQFKLALGWELIGSYSYTPTVVLADNQPDVGQAVVGVPLNKASLWARYVVQDGDLKGLGFSFGGSAYSKQEATLPNTYQIPSYVLANGNISYNRGPYSIRFNVNNLFDRKYISGTYSDLYVVAGDPRTWRLSVGWRH